MFLYICTNYLTNFSLWSSVLFWSPNTSGNKFGFELIEGLQIGLHFPTLESKPDCERHYKLIKTNPSFIFNIKTTTFTLICKKRKRKEKKKSLYCLLDYLLVSSLSYMIGINLQIVNKYDRGTEVSAMIRFCKDHENQYASQGERPKLLSLLNTEVTCPVWPPGWIMSTCQAPQHKRLCISESGTAPATSCSASTLAAQREDACITGHARELSV